MPTYDYVCDACEHAFEEFQSITAKPLKKCPACGKNKLQRLIGTGAGVIFKGDGFYQTDYRSESYKKAAEADKPQSDKSDKSGSSDSSTKSDAKGTSDASSKNDSAGKSDSNNSKGQSKPTKSKDKS
jgi:putative FmdB family regulatory protein